MYNHHLVHYQHFMFKVCPAYKDAMA